MIRPYTPKDYASVKALYIEGGLFEEEIDSEEVIKTKIKRDPESLLVAVKNDQVVGSVSIIEDSRFAFVFRLVVRESERGRGIGTKLLAEAETILKKRGNKTVSILVDEQKAELQEYYKKRGYKKGRIWRWMWKDHQ